MKLPVDMNLSPRWIPFLLDAGCEAVHWSTVGRADATDSEIMAFAAANDYIVLTNDLDFAAILASTHHKKPSVVQIRALRAESRGRPSLPESTKKIVKHTMLLLLRSLERLPVCSPL